jgi:hypothetical protein
MRVTVKPSVLRALRRSKIARRDNRYLMFEVWRDFGLILTPEQEEIISRLPQPESIRRCRAHVQNVEGRFRRDEEPVI